MDKLSNSYRRYANAADARAEKWLAMLKKMTDKDSKMVCARQYRRCKADARESRKKAEEYAKMGI